MSRALWCVLNGRAMAPPGMGCIIGVEVAEEREVVAELVGARVELQPAGAVHEVREGRLAVVAHGHQAPGQAHGAESLQLGVGGLLQPRGEVARRVRDRVAPAEGVDTAAAQRLQFLLALADQVVGVARLLAHWWPPGATLSPAPRAGTP